MSEEKIRNFPSGATRDTDTNKLDFQGFTSSIAMEQVDNYIMRQRDLAWAAGLFEGEGSVYLKNQAPKKDGTLIFHPCINMAITDEDVLQKFVAIIGVGKAIPEHCIRKGANKLRWGWSVQGKNAYRVATILFPYLGMRRKNKFIEIFGNEKVEQRWNMSILVLEKYAQYLHKHKIQSNGEIRSSDNWKKGIPLSAYAKSMWRHFLDVMKGHEGYLPSEKLQDALCAVIFNAMGYLHEILKDKG